MQDSLALDTSARDRQAAAQPQKKWEKLINCNLESIYMRNIKGFRVYIYDCCILISCGMEAMFEFEICLHYTSQSIHNDVN